MFSQNTKIIISEDGVAGWSDTSPADTKNEFYKKNYHELQEHLVEGESITCIPLSHKFGRNFSQSPPYILMTKKEENDPIIFKATNYGMVIYDDIDPNQSIIQIDTQSLYFCTRIVVISDEHVVDIHFPIDEKALDHITSTMIDETIQMIINAGINMASAKWYTISGNLRNMSKKEDDQNPNVSQKFVSRIIARLQEKFAFPPENFSPIDMQIKIDYQVDFTVKSLLPINVMHSPVRNNSSNDKLVPTNSSSSSSSGWSAWSSDGSDAEGKVSAPISRSTSLDLEKVKYSPFLSHTFTSNFGNSSKSLQEEASMLVDHTIPRSNSMDISTSKQGVVFPPNTQGNHQDSLVGPQEEENALNTALSPISNNLSKKEDFSDGKVPSPSAKRQRWS